MPCQLLVYHAYVRLLHVLHEVEVNVQFLYSTNSRMVATGLGLVLGLQLGPGLGLELGPGLGLELGLRLRLELGLRLTRARARAKAKARARAKAN